MTLTLLIIWSDFNNNDFLLLLQNSFLRVKGWIFKHLVLQVRWHPLSTLIDRFLVLTDATTPVPHVFVRDYIPPPPQLKRGVNQIQSSQSWLKKSLIFIETSKTSWKIWVAQVLTISKSSISFWEVFGSNFDLYVTEVINTCCTLMEVSMRCATSSMRRWACA